MRDDERSTSTSTASGCRTISFVSGRASRRRRQKLRTSAPRVSEIAPMQTAAGRCSITSLTASSADRSSGTNVIVLAPTAARSSSNAV